MGFLCPEPAHCQPDRRSTCKTAGQIVEALERASALQAPQLVSVTLVLGIPGLALDRADPGEDRGAHDASLLAWAERWWTGPVEARPIRGRLATGRPGRRRTGYPSPRRGPVARPLGSRRCRPPPRTAPGSGPVGRFAATMRAGSG